MKQDNGSMSYVDILRNTRQMLQSRYAQIPQLSAGERIDLNRPFQI
jgi:hypothetical protein